MQGSYDNKLHAYEAQCTTDLASPAECYDVRWVPQLQTEGQVMAPHEASPS